MNTLTHHYEIWSINNHNSQEETELCLIITIHPFTKIAIPISQTITNQPLTFAISWENKPCELLLTALRKIESTLLIEKLGEIEKSQCHAIETLIAAILPNDNELEKKQAKQIQQIQAECQERINTIINHSFDAFAMVDSHGIIWEWNNKMSTLTGIPREKAITQYIWDVDAAILNISKDSERYDTIKSKSLQYIQNKPFNEVHQHGVLFKKNDASVFIESSTFPLQLPNGNFFARVTRDITDYHKIKLELDVQKSQLEKFVQQQNNELVTTQINYLFLNSPDAIAIIEIDDNNFSIKNHNMQWEQLIDPISVNPKSPSNQKMLSNFFSIIEEDIFNCTRHKNTLKLNKEWESLAGWKYFNITFIPINNKESSLINEVAIIIQDLTEQTILMKKFEERDSLLKVAFENLPFHFWVINKQGRYEYLNKKAIADFGDWTGKHPTEININKDIVDIWVETNNKTLKGETFNSCLNYEIKGEMKYFHSIICPINNNNEITGALGVDIDITEETLNHKRIEESEQRFRTLFNSGHEAIVILNNSYDVLDANKKFFEITQYNLADVYLKNAIEFVPDSYTSIIKERAIKVLLGEESQWNEVELTTKSGNYIPIEIKSQLIKFKNEDALLVNIRDISERKLFERKLLEMNITIEERERKKLAADLHDEVGPLLSSINMYFSSLARKPEIAPYENNINNIKEIISETVTTVREISRNISPHVLTNFGLHQALLSFFNSKQNLIKINLSDNIEAERFDEITEIMVYRILKESFNNTMKHAEATMVDIAVQLNQDLLSVSYKDNGVGFDYKKLRNEQKGIGLASIINRIKILGGNCQIETSPGKGFQISFTLKINNNGEN